MSKNTQHARIAKLLTRKGGCTSLEIIKEAGTVSPHSRLAELKKKGWTITRTTSPFTNYGRYFGKAPK